MGQPVEPNREVDPVLRIVILLVIIVALFLALPLTPAVAWSSVPFLLLAALFFDAYRRGRRLLLARKAEESEDTVVETSRFLAGMMLFNAVWIGLDGNAAAMADGAYDAHGMDGGAGLGGLDVGGFDSGGGDSGAGGGL